MPRPTLPLSETACRNAKAKPTIYRMFDGGGLYLEVQPSGQRYWRLKFPFAGRERRMAFGVYPEVSLAEARQRRDAARALLRDGIDPALARVEEKRATAVAATNSFETVAREWHKLNYDRWTPDYAHDLMVRLERDIFPHLGTRPIDGITPAQMLEVLKRIEARGALEITHRAKQTCGKIFRYAIATSRADRDPSRDIGDALRPAKIKHYPALDPSELPLLLQKIDAHRAHLHGPTQDALELILLTFVRTSELIEARWSEIDFAKAEWTIPAERMKMRRPHIVPLSRQALAVLDRIRRRNGNDELVFPHRSYPRRAMSNATILRALERMGLKGRMTGHGFRALAMSTIKEELGYRHEVVDRQLAHAPKNKIEAAYDRAKFLADRKRMMQEWADHIDVKKG